MKKIFDFLQNRAILICVLFGITPYMPSVLQKSLGGGMAAMMTWVLLFASAVVFSFCYWWLKASWVLSKPANMMAVTFASVLGLMISTTALIGMYGYGTFLYLLWRDTPANIVQAGMIVSLLCQIFGINPFSKSSS